MHKQKVRQALSNSGPLIEIHFLPLRGSIFKLRVASPGAAKSQMHPDASFYLDSLVASAAKEFPVKSNGYLLWYLSADTLISCTFFFHF